MNNNTYFKKVIDFNTQFGVLQDHELNPKLEIFDQDPDQVEFCLKLIREEMKELEYAVTQKDYVETVDALTDIIYVVLGMGCRIGVDMDKVFDLVHDNNMSKLCKTEEDAKASVKHYIDNFEKYGYDSPAYRKAPDNIHWVVYNESTKKILKSIRWKPVELLSVCQ
jgi:phosphoribosyl-ATP pyrophosphohydrolase